MLGLLTKSPARPTPPVSRSAALDARAALLLSVACASTTAAVRLVALHGGKHVTPAPLWTKRAAASLCLATKGDKGKGGAATGERERFEAGAV